jgi:hypothetical protein
MAEAQQPASSQAKLVPFAKRKPAQIGPELKAFLDECIVPLLIRDALGKLDSQNSKNAVVFESPSVADCGRKNVEASR